MVQFVGERIAKRPCKSVQTVLVPGWTFVLFQVFCQCHHRFVSNRRLRCPVRVYGSESACGKSGAHSSPATFSHTIPYIGCPQLLSESRP